MAHVPAAMRRTQIIAAATTVIADVGVAGATTRRIAAEVGLSLATLHYVFGNKEEILAGVLESLIDHARDYYDAVAEHLVAAPGEEAPDLSDLITHLIRTAWDLVRGDLVIQRVQFELTFYALRTPDAAHLGRALHEYHLAAIADIIRRTVDFTGQVIHRSPQDLAHLINCAIDGILLNYLVTNDPEQADRSVVNLADAVFAISTSRPTADAAS